MLSCNAKNRKYAGRRLFVGMESGAQPPRSAPGLVRSCCEGPIATVDPVISTVLGASDSHKCGRARSAREIERAVGKIDNEVQRAVAAK